MVMPSRSSSSGMQSIRRELQRRRAKPLAPKSSVTKKTSTPGQEDPSSNASKSPPASAGVHATRTSVPRAKPSPRPAVISPSTPPPSRSAASTSAGSACRSSCGAAAHLRPGTSVGVRTRTTKLKTGKVLVLWLRATVVSQTQEGYEVVYDANWPPADPHGTVHVPHGHVRIIKPSLSSTTPPPSVPPSSCTPCRSSAFDTTATASVARKKEMRPAPRPTTAGKSLRLVRSLCPELERHARPVFLGY